MKYEKERFLHYVEKYQHFQLVSGFSTKTDKGETHHALDAIMLFVHVRIIDN